MAQDISGEAKLLSVNDIESFDQSGIQESGLTVTDAAPSAINERMEVIITLTDSNFAAGDTVQFEFFRDGVGGTPDTMSDNALLFGLFFEYDTV